MTQQKAYSVRNDRLGLTDGIVKAVNASKARYRAYLGARDVFDWRDVNLIEFRVRRAPRFDGVDLGKPVRTIEYAERQLEASCT